MKQLERFSVWWILFFFLWEKSWNGVLCGYTSLRAELVLNQCVVIGKAYISIWMLLKSSNFKSKLSSTKENTNKIILIMTSLLTPCFPLHLQVLSTITALYFCSFPHLSSIHFSLQSSEKYGGEILIRVSFAALTAALTEQEVVVRSLKIVKREGV